MAQLNNLKTVIQKTSLSRSSIYRLLNEGKFPKPIQLTPMRIAFDAEKVDAWIRARIEGGAK